MEDIKNLNNISIDEEELNKEESKNVFCEYWDSAATVLGVLKNVIKNPIAKLVITIVIDLGNSIKAKVCPQA